MRSKPLPHVWTNPLPPAPPYSLCDYRRSSRGATGFVQRRHDKSTSSRTISGQPAPIRSYCHGRACPLGSALERRRILADGVLFHHFGRVVDGPCDAESIAGRIPPLRAWLDGRRHASLTLRFPHRPVPDAGSKIPCSSTPVLWSVWRLDRGRITASVNRRGRLCVPRRHRRSGRTCRPTRARFWSTETGLPRRPLAPSQSMKSHVDPSRFSFRGPSTIRPTSKGQNDTRANCAWVYCTLRSIRANSGEYESTYDGPQRLRAGHMTRPICEPRTLWRRPVIGPGCDAGL